MESNDIPLYRRLTPHKIPENECVAVVGRFNRFKEDGKSFFIDVDQNAKITIEIVLPPTFQSAELINIKFIEVRGRALAWNKIELKEYTNFKAEFDLAVYNEVVQLANENNFKTIFNNR